MTDGVKIPRTDEELHRRLMERPEVRFRLQEVLAELRDPG
jgi:hypothetical protein